MKCKPNDELRHDWRRSLENRRGLAASTISAKLAALAAYDEFTGYRAFQRLEQNDVIAFKEHLLSHVSPVTGQKLSYSTVVHTLDHCRDFFNWLADTKDGIGLHRETIEWFRASRADRERARAVDPRPIPSLEQARAAFAAMPTDTLLRRRDRAIMAFLLVSAIRANALASLTVSSVDLAKNAIRQDGRYVRTKFSRSYLVFFIPFVPEALVCVEAWVNEIKALGLSGDDALFPGDAQIQSLVVGRGSLMEAVPCWRGSAQVRAVVRNAFSAIGLRPYVPHVFRHMLTRYMMTLQLTPAEVIALSINLGHKKLETTFAHYARPDDGQRAHLVAGVARKNENAAPDTFNALIDRLTREHPQLAAEVIRALATG